ncbi:MAG: hypothetical protein COB15_07160 [Flavobacteriales bacterium]|nr:MAG: hypothetical protein COB15_07160 [Flavobacteriales bacterium]
MSGGDLPPRQKMIGMMYLVLTALLAMNVSKSILDAFVNINTGIQSTGATIDANNGFVYLQFDKARNTGGANGRLWAEKSDKVKKMANDMFDHIEKLKSGLIAAVEGVPLEVSDTLSLAAVLVKDNYDIPTQIMGIADPANSIKVPGKEEFSGKTLKEKLNKYQTGLIGIFETKEVKSLIKDKIKYLDTPEIPGSDGDQPWEVGLFYHVPLAAVITLLSKTQSDVRSAESEVISKLYERIDAGGVSFNKIVGMAVLPKAYLTPSDSFTADIFTAAYDDRVNPEVYIFSTENGGVDSALFASGETNIEKLMKGTKGKEWGDGSDWYQMDEKEVINGKGKLKIKPSIGAHNWGGLIKLNTKKGPKVYDFKSSFEVGVPSFAVSADKMNVFYMGVDNPVSVSAPMPKFTASGPGLSKSGKGWVMRPRKPGKVKINVTGIDEATGNNVAVGSAEFRVKRIPTPVAFIAGKTGTVTLSKSQLGSGVLQAKLEGFVFDLKVKCKSFELGTTVNGDYKSIKVSGNRMNSNAKNLIKRSSRGQRFYLEKMAVRMPDGRTVTMGNMTVKIK